MKEGIPLNQNTNLWLDSNIADQYDKYIQNNEMYWILARSLVAGIIPSNNETTIIDLACGTGVVSRVLRNEAGFNGRILALDSSIAMLDLAKKRCIGLNIEFDYIDHQSPRITSESADIIICNAAIWQLNPKNIILEFSRCRPGTIIAYNYPLQAKSKPDKFPNFTKSPEWKIYKQEYFSYMTSSDEAKEFFSIAIFNEQQIQPYQISSSWGLETLIKT